MVFKKSLFLFILSALIVSCSSSSPVQEEELGVPTEEEQKPVEEAKTEVWQWAYDGNKGPEHWASLNPQYDMCQSGQYQSPVNLVWHKPESTSPLKVIYKEGDATVTNAGYTFRLELTPQSQITFNGQDYLLEKIEFRTPSEHQLSGNT